MINKGSFIAEARWQKICRSPYHSKEDGPRVDRPNAHHVVYEQHVRHEDPDRIYDVDNCLRLCGSCHADHHGRKRPIPVSALRDENLLFAVSLMGRDRALNYLNRYYDNSDRTLTDRVDGLLAEEQAA